MGTWYFEIELVHLGDTGHARLGVATGEAELQAPVSPGGGPAGPAGASG